MSNIMQDGLPVNWEFVKIGDICSTTSGGTPSRKIKKYYEGEIPWVKSGELNDGLISDIEEYITDEAIAKSSAKIFPSGTLLMALYGATVGKLGIITKDAATNQAVCAIFPPENVKQKYLFWYFRHIRSNLIASAIGGAQPNISQGIIKNTFFPLAPLNEQTRIVAEIEKQFSRLDQAVENLKRVKINLKRYKAAVLKAAVEGKLTEEWRKNHQDVEPADKLIERTLIERRNKWEKAELANMKGKGKVPEDNKWKQKYKEPIAPITEGLKKLPHNWMWCSLGQLIQIIKAGKSFKCNERPPEGEEIGVVKVSSVTWGEFNELESKTVTDKSKINQDYLIHQGDFLFSRANTIELVGACVIAGSFKRKLMLSDKILRLDLTFDLKKWCLICLRTRFGRNEIESLATGNQESMRNISQTNIMKIRLPLPPLEEQDSIIKELEKILTQCEVVNKVCEENLKRADRLRQSILKKAFSGQLVPIGNSVRDKE